MDDDLVVPEGVALDPFAPGFYADPYPQYAALREHDPVHHTFTGGWLVTRWDDVHTMLRNPATSVEDRNLNTPPLAAAAYAEATGGAADRGSRGILRIDPPDHTRIRRLVSKAFTPRTVDLLRPRIAELVDTLLTTAAERGDGRIDVIADLAFPLPFAVISEMLGMPPADQNQLRAWSHTLVQSLDPILAMTKMDEILDASNHIVEAVTEAIAWKRSRPDDDDLLNALIKADEGGQKLTDQELLDNVVLLFIAGHETTVNLIGNGTLALLRHPDQADLLRATPALAGNAVEELLRYDSPVQFSRRILLQPLEIGGTAIDTGDFVMTGLGAANRDPDHFGPTADRLDLTRADANHHVSFGSGVHHCLGAALARLEGREAVPALFGRFPRMTLLDDPPAWNGRLILRGLDTVNVSLDG
jgi:cytochrome P450